MKRNVLIACGDRNPTLDAALEADFANGAARVLRSQSTTRDEIFAELAALEQRHGGIDALVYVSPDPVEIDFLDDADAHLLDGRLESDFAAGAWWLQAAARSMVERRVPGSLAFVSHVSAIVPTQRFSFSAMSQAMLMNLARTALLELDHVGIRFNFIVRGWAERGAEKAFFEALQEVHGEDHYPPLHYASDADVASACTLVSGANARAINGATLTIDGGFAVSRLIRQIPAD
ncbi:SDR family oxidoreductase [Paraburkholderia aspalathi]|jgi:NAD(P)-dependent dehydrogenase (short-subunit alcohol dehydrogenase family)|uniref:NAD(P)-dependent dehydrogenase, short-chain alcohol dehydrogenase family n=1 Tax=Paraburkholderia aspalathi TaxID=1324617 RepID=A0A1I7DA97_9BURK|nr:SDR family oxidoreductase [Paraburkholderia aspalathi]SFU08546.1 NAD(P)-dependent dehydrogenase, short-chain alcohol dehydrogenase family [Paraburkholderia aspalathi]